MRFDTLCEIYLDRYLYPPVGQSTNKKMFKRRRETPSMSVQQDYGDSTGIAINGWEIFKKETDYSRGRGNISIDISAVKDEKVGVEIDMYPYGKQGEYQVSHISKFFRDAPPVAEIYHRLITKLGFVLHADKHQSIGGMNVWKKLISYPDINILYMDVNDDSDHQWRLLKTKDPVNAGMLWSDREDSPLANIRLKAVNKNNEI